MNKSWYLQGLVALALACSNLHAAVIRVSPDAGPLERLAAKEIRRYIYLRTDALLPIQSGNESPSGDDLIVIGLKGQTSVSGDFENEVGYLESQEYRLKTIRHPDRSVLWIVGGDAVGLLYGAYRFAETLGVRFYLHGDTVPDRKAPFKIPDLDIKGKPLFHLRGILPFHDFPEGPDWWNLEDYKAVIAQLPKLGMNFIGFHTYPERADFNGEGYRAEPMTWIGPKEDIQPDGAVTTGYPNLHFNTADHTWGYSAMRTSQFALGAGQLFERDIYGPDHMAGKAPWPHTAEENIETFNDFGNLLEQAFSLAKRLGVKTCIGTETYLTIPLDVRLRLRAQGKDPEDPAVIQSLYEGMFERIKRIHPLDYYWMWTPESWTWQDVPDEDIARTEKDMLLAVAAAEKVDAPFTLATCGWVLGPPNDRAQFDRVLPEEMPFSCINRGVGFTPVEPGFAQIDKRPKWAIPWLEDDPALISPQLWVGRMRMDAVEALAYGCTGLIGIHWRTRILGPNVNALAKAGWEQGAWSRAGVAKGQRDLPVEDYYEDWARSQFGTEAAIEVAAVFSRLDGGPLGDVEGPRIADLYRTSTWIQGPGAIRTIEEPWEEVSSRFDFVDELLALRQRIRGAGNLERFDYWLNSMRFAKATARVGCTLGELAALSEEVKKTSSPAQKKKMVLEQALPMRQQLYEQWATMTDWLLLTVTNPSELGTIANLEQHNRRRLNLLATNDPVFAEALNRPLPTLQLPVDYRGPTRIIVPTLRTTLEADQDLNLKVLLMGSEQLTEATFFWRPLGEPSYQSIPLAHLARSVYEVQLPAGEIQRRDFEYYIQADGKNSQAIVYPVSAPQINQTVVILE